MMRSFWLGSTSAKRVVRSASVPERLVAQVVQLGCRSARRAPAGSRPPRRARATIWLSPVMILSCTPALRQIDDRLLHIGFRRIEEEQEAGESQCRFHRRANRIRACASAVFVATPRTRKPCSLHSL